MNKVRLTIREKRPICDDNYATSNNSYKDNKNNNRNSNDNNNYINISQNNNNIAGGSGGEMLAAYELVIKTAFDAGEIPTGKSVACRTLLIEYS